jgi:putative peptidoglycan binding protein
VPRKIANEDDRPRRRRGAKAIAVAADSERGLLVRLLLHSPKDTIAAALALATACGIITNALFLQSGHHPSPMFGSSVVMMPVSPAPTVQANPIPRPRPIEAELSPPEPKFADPKPADGKPADAKPAEPRSAEPKAADPVANLVNTTAPAAAQPANAVRPPAPIPQPVHGIGPRRIAAVQRALTEYGYGQLKPTGAMGAETQVAIQKFEREHNMPVTGQVSDRLVRVLTTMIGHPVE